VLGSLCKTSPRCAVTAQALGPSLGKILETTRAPLVPSGSLLMNSWFKQLGLRIERYPCWRVVAGVYLPRAHRLHHRPRAGPTLSARAESDRVACLCPSPPFIFAIQNVQSGPSGCNLAWHRSSLEPANAQRLGGLRLGGWIKALLSNDRVG